MTAPSAPKGPDHMLSLERGLSVLRIMAHAGPPRSIAQIAAASGLPRATARRCLLTLASLDYVVAAGGGYSPGPGMASLATIFIAASPLLSQCQPTLDSLRDRFRESASLGIFEDGQVIFVAQAPVRGRWRKLAPLGGAIPLGRPMPAYCTAIGRVLLANLPVGERERYLASIKLQRLTPTTITDIESLRAILADVAEQGFALVDGELEQGLRAIAVPVLGQDGQVVAAINIGALPERAGVRGMHVEMLPVLREAAASLRALNF